MLRSSRSNPVIAGFVILVLTFSQLVALGSQTSQDQSVKPSDSKQKPALKKRSKKKKKKKKAPEPVNYQASLSWLGETSSLKSTKQLSTTPIATTPIASVPSRGTNRAAKTPRVHITPVDTPGAPSFSGSNGSPITVEAINPNPEQPIQPAVPYSSDIEVFGLTGVVTSVSVSINGLSHSNPDDLDMLLVAPGGQRFHFWSDVGGSTDVESLTVTVADNGTETLPDDAPLVSGTTYRPFNNELQGELDTDTDEFPVPAPGPPYAEPVNVGSATFASVFAGLTGDEVGGTWQLFVTDDKEGDGGSIANGWTLNITTQLPPTTAGQLIISEFRTKGPEGPTDEFVELYNTTDAPLIVQASDESAGLGVAASDGVVRCVVPNGTVIPKGGHFLCANGGAKKSLSRNPKVTANLVDQFYGLDIPDNAGIALFSSSASVSNTQSISTRLDAVGSTLEENSLYKEGTGYPAITANNLDHSFYRDLRPGGQPKDTGNNASDFLFVDTSATATEAGQRLGSPGPQGLTDSRTANEAVVVNLGFPCRTAGEVPNRIRSLIPDQQGNSALGTLRVVKSVTNTTVNDISTLRFRTFDITTAPAPNGGIADLRWLNSDNQIIADVCGGEDAVQALGITLDGPARPLGGGFNTSGTVNLAQPLLPGETILVNFLWGIQQTGSFRVIVNIEILP